MPTSTTPQAEVLRAQLALLTARAIDDLLQLVRFDSAAAARRTLVQVLPQLVRVYGPAAQVVSADWYDEQRALVKPKARFTASVPVIDFEKVDAQMEVLARWGVSPLAVPETKVAPDPVKPVAPAEPDPEAAKTLISQGLEKAILDTSRDVLTTAAVDDPGAHGWQRVGHGECAFCALLIGRGGVYTRGTVDFASHNGCRCTAAPAWGGRELPVKPYEVSHRRKLGKDGKPLPITPAERARIKAYIEAHPELGADFNRSGRSGSTSSKPKGTPVAAVDIDASKTTAELQQTLAALEDSLKKFDSPGTRARVEDLRRKIRARA